MQRSKVILRLLAKRVNSTQSGLVGCATRLNGSSNEHDGVDETIVTTDGKKEGEPIAYERQRPLIVVSKGRHCTG